MPGGVADLGQSTTTGQRVADEGVAAVVDGKLRCTLWPKALAGGSEAPADDVAVERPSSVAATYRADWRIVWGRF